jgi:hypothetical protein
MNIIKEYYPPASKCILRTDTYGCSFELIRELFDEARRDFPELEAKDVEVVLYAGTRYAHTLGIEFRTNGPVPATYSEIPKLEQNS